MFHNILAELLNIFLNLNGCCDDDPSPNRTDTIKKEKWKINGVGPVGSRQYNCVQETSLHQPYAPESNNIISYNKVIHDYSWSSGGTSRPNGRSWDAKWSMQKKLKNSRARWRKEGAYADIELMNINEQTGTLEYSNKVWNIPKIKFQRGRLGLEGLLFNTYQVLDRHRTSYKSDLAVDDYAKRLKNRGILNEEVIVQLSNMGANRFSTEIVRSSDRQSNLDSEAQQRWWRKYPELMGENNVLRSMEFWEPSKRGALHRYYSFSTVKNSVWTTVYNDIYYYRQFGDKFRTPHEKVSRVDFEVAVQQREPSSNNADWLEFEWQGSLPGIGWTTRQHNAIKVPYLWNIRKSLPKPDITFQPRYHPLQSGTDIIIVLEDMVGFDSEGIVKPIILGQFQNSTSDLAGLSDVFWYGNPFESPKDPNGIHNANDMGDTSSFTPLPTGDFPTEGLTEVEIEDNKDLINDNWWLTVPYFGPRWYLCNISTNMTSMSKDDAGFTFSERCAEKRIIERNFGNNYTKWEYLWGADGEHNSPLVLWRAFKMGLKKLPIIYEEANRDITYKEAEEEGLWSELKAWFLKQTAVYENKPMPQSFADVPTTTVGVPIHTPDFFFDIGKGGELSDWMDVSLKNSDMILNEMLTKNIDSMSGKYFVMANNRHNVDSNVVELNITIMKSEVPLIVGGTTSWDSEEKIPGASDSYILLKKSQQTVLTFSAKNSRGETMDSNLALFFIRDIGSPFEMVDGTLRVVPGMLDDVEEGDVITVAVCAKRFDKFSKMIRSDQTVHIKIYTGLHPLNKSLTISDTCSNQDNEILINNLPCQMNSNKIPTTWSLSSSIHLNSVDSDKFEISNASPDGQTMELKVKDGQLLNVLQYPYYVTVIANHNDEEYAYKSITVIKNSGDGSGGDGSGGDGSGGDGSGGGGGDIEIVGISLDDYGDSTVSIFRKMTYVHQFTAKYVDGDIIDNVTWSKSTSPDDKDLYEISDDGVLSFKTFPASGKFSSVMSIVATVGSVEARHTIRITIQDMPNNVVELQDGVTIYNSQSGGNFYLFNGDTEYDSTKKFKINISQEITLNVPETHPITIVDIKDMTGKPWQEGEPLLTYGGENTVMVDGVNYYWGAVILLARQNFSTASVKSSNSTAPIDMDDLFVGPTFV